MFSIRERSPIRIVCVAIGWILAATIVWLSVTPSPPRIDIEQGDKFGHFAAYGTLMFWFCLLYKSRATRFAYAILWIAMGVEFIQGQTDYRTYDVYDMCANTVGVLIGWAISLAFPLALPGTERGTR